MTSGGRATPFPLQGDPAPSCTDAVTKAGTNCSSPALPPLLSSQPRHCLGTRSQGLVLLSFSPALRVSPAREVLPRAGIMAPVFSLCTSLPRQLPNPAQLRLPLLQDDVSASQSGRAGLARPAWLLAPVQLPPPSWLSLRRGSLRSRSHGRSGGRGIGGEGKKKKPYTKNRQPNPPRRQPPFRATTGRTRASSPSQAP